MTNSASTEFQQVEDAKEARTLLKEGSDANSPATLWTKSQEILLQTRISLFSEAEKVLYFWIPPGFEPEKLEAHLKSKKEEVCFLNVSLPKASIFFKARYLGRDEGGFRFALPEEIYKVQRRKFLRFPVVDGIALKAEFDDPHFEGKRLSYRIVDISAGGIALFANADDTAMLPSGQKLNNLTLNILGRKIQAEGEVKHKKPFKHPVHKEGSKIGVNFTRIAEADADQIAKFVLEESRKYFTKMF